MLPEWTGELWQWVLLIGACGGLGVFMALFACALTGHPKRDCLTCSFAARGSRYGQIFCALDSGTIVDSADAKSWGVDAPAVNDVLTGKVDCEYWQ